MSRAWVCGAIAALPLALSAQQLPPGRSLIRRRIPGPLTTAITPAGGSARSRKSMPPMSGSLAIAWTYRASNYGAASFGSVIKSTPLEVNGILYFTMPDNVWAVDARTGRESGTTNTRPIRRRPHRPSRRGHVGQLAVLRNAGLLSDLPERQKRARALAQTNCRCEAGVLLYDGAAGGGQPHHCGRRRRFAGQPRLSGSRTIRKPATCNGAGTPSPPRESRVRRPGPMRMPWGHGGGMTWMTGTYDPDLTCSTGAPAIRTRCMPAQARKGDNLWTCSIVALNPDTGQAGLGLPALAA